MEHFSDIYCDVTNFINTRIRTNIEALKKYNWFIMDIIEYNNGLFPQEGVDDVDGLDPDD